MSFVVFVCNLSSGLHFFMGRAGSVEESFWYIQIESSTMGTEGAVTIRNCFLQMA